MLRTYALWNNNKVILVLMLSTFIAIILSSIGSRLTTTISPDARFQASQAVIGARTVFNSRQFVLLFVFQLGLFSLTLTRVIQSWRTTRGHLHAILVKHNIFYYACGLFFSGMNALVSTLMPDSVSYVILENFQVLIFAILATRMHLYLWHIDRHVHCSDALIYVSMSDMPPTDLTV
ncbi:hypothetical protein BD769DRAFT_1693454 [Suillus cothurnatus]|nr:hypothetical protein BD769DRAFT_1693454 [Suillus cothurnatus]